MIKNKEYYDNLKKFKKIEIDTIKNKVFKDKNVIIPTDNFSPFDFIYEDKKCIIELKNRNITSIDFVNKYDGIMMIEKGKVDRLLNLVKNSRKYKGYLACFMLYFTDNVYQYVILNYIDFSKVDLEVQWVPKTQLVSGYDYIKKDVYKLQTSLLNNKNFVRRTITV